MRRSILVSLMVIGAVVAVVAGASTFAPFTNNASIQGTVNSATLTLDLDDDGPTTNSETSLTFDLASVCDSELTDSDVCKVEVLVDNTGNIAFTYTMYAWSDSDATDTGTDGPAGETFDDCYYVSLSLTGFAANAAAIGTNTNTSLSPTNTEYPGADATDLNDDETQIVFLSVTVNGTDQACQTQVGDILVYVAATQSATPHD